jgi:hypothetical protein
VCVCVCLVGWLVGLFVCLLCSSIGIASHNAHSHCVCCVVCTVFGSPRETGGDLFVRFVCVFAVLLSPICNTEIDGPSREIGLGHERRRENEPIRNKRNLCMDPLLPKPFPHPNTETTPNEGTPTLALMLCICLCVCLFVCFAFVCE